MSGRQFGTEPVDADAGLEDAARAYLAAAEGDADRALRLALCRRARGAGGSIGSDLLRLCSGSPPGRACRGRC